MFRFACLTLLLLLGSEIRLSHCTEVRVNNKEGKLCLYADLSVHFAVTYNSTDKMNSTVAFLLPEVVNASGSTCGKDSSTLLLSFGKGHSWTVTFSKENTTYNVHDIRRHSGQRLGRADSVQHTVCARDRSTTTAMPTTHTTTVTTLPTTPTPLPTPPTDFHKMNIGKDQFKTSGKCGVNGSDATLVLSSSTVNMTFTFHEEGKKFLLHALNVTIKGTNGTINQGNTNLSLWEASVGSSYMCNKEQSYNISNGLTLNTFSLQVQPFGVKDNKFATAQECSMDDTNILIPIIVGAALAGLIVIVLIAYAIGRRKTYVGYQSL
ncbi:hypothetical protein JZ751_025495 [Albula glossodonta]|uniref:Lysosome-associated membrane glycoprotein 2 n=1 Tax=Albula glossodonta TaxID=121402 RepID=A0A8T2NQL7_9TELE|nr:hypothetical protein JZ751_025495 [Albula glossodonta]